MLTVNHVGTTGGGGGGMMGEMMAHAGSLMMRTVRWREDIYKNKNITVNDKSSQAANDMMAAQQVAM